MIYLFIRVTLVDKFAFFYPTKGYRNFLLFTSTITCIHCTMRYLHKVKVLNTTESSTVVENECIITLVWSYKGFDKVRETSNIENPYCCEQPKSTDSRRFYEIWKTDLQSILDSSI